MAGVVENERAGLSDSICTMISPFRRPGFLGFRVRDKVGVIGNDDIFPFIYHTETGEVLESTHEPQNFGFPWITFSRQSDCREYHYLRYHNTPQDDVLQSWSVSRTGLGKAGWVMDSGWKHRFWIPVE